jgi:hypothetical protein
MSASAAASQADKAPSAASMADESDWTDGTANESASERVEDAADNCSADSSMERRERTVCKPRILGIVIETLALKRDSFLHDAQTGEENCFATTILSATRVYCVDGGH